MYSKPFRRVIYLLFCGIGIYYVVARQYMQAVVYIGLALAFDPFDAHITWKARPVYQKGWLLVHALLLMVLLIMGSFHSVTLK
jgi:hypothetical protein